MKDEKMAKTRTVSRAALLLAVLMLVPFCLLAGCNNADQPDPATTAAPDSAPDPTEAPTDPADTPTEPVAPPTEAQTDAPVVPVVKKALISGGGAGNNIYSASVALCEKKNPRIILLCQAGKDTVSGVQSYYNTMRKYSNDIEAITLCTKIYDPQELHDKIVGADLIMVGGGQSEYMMDTWVKFGVDQYLIEAYNKGVVCCGGSAGGMCWTYKGWNNFYVLPDDEYYFFDGLDVVPVYYGPHFSNSELWAQFDSAIRKETNPKYNIGYAMENGSALVFIDGVATKAVRENGTEHIYTYTFADGKWSRVEYNY